VELLPLLVFLNASEDRLVCDADLLEESREVLDAEMTVWASMCLTWARLMLHEDLLAAVGTVPVSSSVTISAYIAVGVSHIISILLVEHIVGDFAEGASPEDQALLERESDPFEEQSVLESPIMLKVSITTQGAVQVLHAKRERGGQRVDCPSGDISGNRRGG
jgi:hypothetical protein